MTNSQISFSYTGAHFLLPQTKDCADSRAVATFGLSFAANGQSILSTRPEPCQYISIAPIGCQRPPILTSMRSPGLAVAVVRLDRLDRLDILAADDCRRRLDTGFLGAAGNETAVAGRSTQSLPQTAYWVRQRGLSAWGIQN